MTVLIDARRLEHKRKAVERSRDGKDKHRYFEGVAQARAVLRKVFRIVAEQAKNAGLDPLAHQALIQIYGSAGMRLRVKEVAERLDISPAFASNLMKTLVARKLVSRAHGGEDGRVVQVVVTKEGIALLHAIDEAVKFHVDYFTGQLTAEQKEAAISILMFYVGASIEIPGAVRRESHR